MSSRLKYVRPGLAFLNSYSTCSCTNGSNAPTDDGCSSGQNFGEDACGGNGQGANACSPTGECSATCITHGIQAAACAPNGGSANDSHCHLGTVPRP